MGVQAPTGLIAIHTNMPFAMPAEIVETAHCPVDPPRRSDAGRAGEPSIN